jgi:CheY-like chemotaxis protein
MKSAKELLHQIHDPSLSVDQRALLRCRLAKHLEEIGNYDAALEALGELWEGVGEDPEVQGLDQRTTAEVLLRAGTLTGWIGSTRQIEGAQETAKNIITRSITIFESIGDLTKVGEAETELGYCYWREGAMDDARVVLKQALSHLEDENADLKAVAYLRSGAIEKVQNRLSDALYIFRQAAPLFATSNNQSLKGRFHNELAIVLEKLGAAEDRADYIEQASMEYTAASLHFEEAGHARYQACIENNLAMLYLKVNRVADAHEHLDRAQALFTRLNDTVHLAQVGETRARAWLKEGAFAKAEKEARLAVQMLETGGEQSLLAEALTTHGTALARLGDSEQARAAFQRAIEVAEHVGDVESAGTAALIMFEQLSEQLSDDEIYQTLERAYELLKQRRNSIARNSLTDALYRALSMVHTFRPNWETFSLGQTLHRHEARYIQMALEDASGNISRAARLLGLSGHQTLHKILKRRHKNLRTVLDDIIASETETNVDADSITNPREVAIKKARAIRVLHVEDDPTLAGLVNEIAESEGWTVQHFGEGIGALEELASNSHYDLLLVDFELPGLDGLELVRKVRGMVHREGITIVMMSGALDRITAIEAGADAFLRKPQDIGWLVETVNRLIEDRGQERDST